MGDKKPAWTRYHDILYLYMSMAVVDQPLGASESAMLLLCMREWKSNLTRSKYAKLYRDVVAKLARRTTGVELIKVVEDRAQVLADVIESDRRRALLLLDHLRRIAQIDGPMKPGEQMMMQAVIHHLGLSDRINLSIRNGFATVTPLERAS